MLDRLAPTFLKWLLICGVCAVPSAVWASRQFDTLGMGLGLLAFVLLYTVINSSDACKRIESRPFVRRSLRIGFGVRIAVSLLFPLGMAIDLIPGMLAVEAIRGTGIPQTSTLGTLFITLIQGGLVNSILLVFILIVYGIQCAMCKPPTPAENTCTSCGYDIRASREFGRCPECGTTC